VQLNGIIGRDGEPQTWIARRSLSKPVGPGKLDQVVGGGLPIGVGLRDNLNQGMRRGGLDPGGARPPGAAGRRGRLSDAGWRHLATTR